jgi:hypothetical protein
VVVSATSCPLVLILGWRKYFWMIFRWYASKFCQHIELHVAGLLCPLASWRYIQSFSAISIYRDDISDFQSLCSRYVVKALVVFAGRSTRLMFRKLSSSGCAGRLSTRNRMFLFCRRNWRS